MDVRQEWQYYCQLFERFLATREDSLREEIAKGVSRVNEAYQQEFQVNNLVILSNEKEKYKVVAFDKKTKFYEVIRPRDEKKGRAPSYVHWGRLRAASGAEQLTLF